MQCQSSLCLKRSGRESPLPSAPSSTRRKLATRCFRITEKLLQTALPGACERCRVGPAGFLQPARRRLRLAGGWNLCTQQTRCQHSLKVNPTLSHAWESHRSPGPGCPSMSQLKVMGTPGINPDKTSSNHVVEVEKVRRLCRTALGSSDSFHCK